MMTQRSTATPKHSCTCAHLRKLTRRVTRIYDEYFAVTGLSTNQYSLLAHTGRGPQSMAQLAEALEMDRTTLTRLLKPLVAAGWIEFSTGDDARRRMVRLTRAGQRKRAAAFAVWQRAQFNFEAALGASLVAELHETTARAINSIRQLDAKT